MRVVLAVAVLLVIVIDPSALNVMANWSEMVFVAYVLHSLALYAASQFDKAYAQSKWIHWLDIGWYGLMVLVTGGISSVFFLFFFFAILTSSFRWGFEEGAHVTVASAALSVASAGVSDEPDLTRLLLRTSFLFSLGYICAYWGESRVALKRKLALLHDVSLLSNPRFGVDHTLTRVLDKTCKFYGGSACLLVMRDDESGAYTLRAIKQSALASTISPEPIDAAAARALMEFEGEPLILHGLSAWLPLKGGTLQREPDQGTWSTPTLSRIRALSELLEVRSFVSAPVPSRRGAGRVYVLGDRNNFTKSDAVFLNHIVAQAFPAIETIELLDRMASEAASRERQKFARDLHDTAIQPYIGLNLGLSAVRRKAAPDNPLNQDLDKLGQMAYQVIEDLRRFAGSFRAENTDLHYSKAIPVNHSNASHPDKRNAEPTFLQEALHQQAAQVREFYGIHIDVDMRCEVHVNDRLTAEVLQMVREALSNICRHTEAQSGSISMECTPDGMHIRVSNASEHASSFIPQSITERAKALGGTAWVNQGQGGNTTTVHIQIPL